MNVDVDGMVSRICQLIDVLPRDASFGASLGRETVIWPDAPTDDGFGGLDSLASMELIAALEDELGIELLEAITDSVRTIGDLAELCRSLRADATVD